MPPKILIIEDDRFLRKIISQKLTKENYNLIEAVDGIEGIKKAQEEKPDLILLDLVLPGIDGFETLSKIKNNTDKSISKIPVIIFSNLGQHEDIKRGIEIGAVDYLIKAHSTPEEIVAKIRSVLK